MNAAIVLSAMFIMYVVIEEFVKYDSKKSRTEAK